MLEDSHRMAVGDPNDDGQIELLLLWKPDATEVLRSHPFLLGWRGGRAPGDPAEAVSIWR